MVLLIGFAGVAQNISFPLTNELDSVSYALGLNIAAQIKNQGISEINEQKVAEALRHMFDGSDPYLLVNDAGVLFNNYLQQQKSKMAKDNMIKSQAFLDDNGKKEGVITTASGLQYKIIKTGTGPVPTKGQKVSAHYTGKLISGAIFDSSVMRGQPFSVAAGTGRVIKAWDEALLMMPVGSKWELYVPPMLGYGENPRPGSGIMPNDVLIFELELLSIDK